MKKLVITDYNVNNTSGKLSMLFEDNREIRIGIYDNEESVLGNIYVARVRDIVRNRCGFCRNYTREGLLFFDKG